MKYINAMVIIGMLICVQQAAQAGVKFRVRNANQDCLLLFTYPGLDKWVEIAPYAETESFFNTGTPDLQEIQWVTINKKNGKAKAFVASNQTGSLPIITEQGWSWEGKFHIGTKGNFNWGGDLFVAYQKDHNLFN